MKKCFILSISIAIFLSLIYFAYAQVRVLDKTENGKWTKINEYIYFDRNSVKKDRFLTSGWFKIYNSQERELYNPADTPTYYEITQYEVDCIHDGLSLKHTKTYDKNGNLLSDEPNNYNVCSNADGIVDGKIYFGALCKTTGKSD